MFVDFKYRFSYRWFIDQITKYRFLRKSGKKSRCDDLCEALGVSIDLLWKSYRFRLISLSFVFSADLLAKKRLNCRLLYEIWRIRRSRISQGRCQRSSAIWVMEEEPTSSSAADAADQHTCPICLSDLDTAFAKSNACSHRFDEECIYEWAKVSKFIIVYIRTGEGQNFEEKKSLNRNLRPALLYIPFFNNLRQNELCINLNMQNAHCVFINSCLPYSLNAL